MGLENFPLPHYFPTPILSCWMNGSFGLSHAWSFHSLQIGTPICVLSHCLKSMYNHRAGRWLYTVAQDFTYLYTYIQHCSNIWLFNFTITVRKEQFSSRTIVGYTENGISGINSSPCWQSPELPWKQIQRNDFCQKIVVWWWLGGIFETHFSTLFMSSCDGKYIFWKVYDTSHLRDSMHLPLIY